MVLTLSFTDDMDKLQEIVNRLDSGEMSMEESLSLFEKGVALVNSCRTFLESAKQKISLISMDMNDTDGKPWDPMVDDFDKGVDKD